MSIKKKLAILGLNRGLRRKLSNIENKDMESDNPAVIGFKTEKWSIGWPVYFTSGKPTVLFNDKEHYYERFIERDFQVRWDMRKGVYKKREEIAYDSLTGPEYKAIKKCGAMAFKIYVKRATPVTGVSPWIKTKNPKGIIENKTLYLWDFELRDFGEDYDADFTVKIIFSFKYDYQKDFKNFLEVYDQKFSRKEMRVYSYEISLANNIFRQIMSLRAVKLEKKNIMSANFRKMVCKDAKTANKILDSGCMREFAEIEK